MIMSWSDSCNCSPMVQEKKNHRNNKTNGIHTVYNPFVGRSFVGFRFNSARWKTNTQSVYILKSYMGVRVL